MVEIPVVVARYFTPIVEHRRDGLLWKLVDVAYPAHGGPGTELTGVYRSEIGRSRR